MLWNNYCRRLAGEGPVIMVMVTRQKMGLCEMVHVVQLTGGGAGSLDTI
jgi:hypothetical protein